MRIKKASTKFSNDLVNYFCKIRHYFLVILIIYLLPACTLMPGNSLPIGDKVVINSSRHAINFNGIVHVYEINPLLINKLKINAPKVFSRANLTLEQELIDYRYYIGTGDVLNITIWDHPELTIPAGSFRSSAEAGNWVHADGTIFYPYIGRIKVAGLTVTDVRSIISNRLAKYIETPQVDVNVAAFRSQKTYLTGEVSNPGPMFITNIPLTLLDAINKAGGITQDADWHNVTLTRNGIEQQISLYALIQRGDLTQNRLLENGDIIHVPLNDSQKVFVMGEVNLPQTLKIDRTGMSLTEALSHVGGIDQLNADATGIFVIRNNQHNLVDEKKEDLIADIYQLNIKDATALVLGTEFELQPYDVVYVTAAPISRWNRIIGQLLPTISGFNELSEGILQIRNW